MKCPDCQFDNPEGAKFCMNCGLNQQSSRCANCQTKLPTGARFCFECGQPTSARSAADHHRHVQLTTQAPDDLSSKIRSPDRAVGERRIVTSLFADVVGSTALAETLDPEDWTYIMNSAFQRITKTIYTYEGTIARLMGDALLAFFGAPVGHEDDPERAVRAGLDLISEVDRFARDIEEDFDVIFQMRVGINTGEVVVGSVGSDLIYEYTAMGDAINLAARMEQTANPGTVQISEYTYKLIAPLFDVEPLGPVEVKGKGEPIRAYSVIRSKISPGRLRGIEGLQFPLVGRKKELDALKGIVTETRNGRGQIVTVVGEAGLGKSRLIEELLGEWNLLSEFPDDRFQYQGISYESERPYGIFRHSLLKQFHMSEDQSRDVILAHITEHAGPNGPDEKFVTAIKTLLRLGAVVDEATEESQRGEEYKRVIYEGILSPMRQQLQTMPALYIFDDLHWFDPASVDLVEHMLQFADEFPVLFFFATRPERLVPGWRLVQTAEREYRHRFSSFHLNPLTNEDAERLVSNLKISEMPASIQALIRQKAEGNPFFLEEIVRSLMQRGLVVRENGMVRWDREAEFSAIDIPDNVNALLTARIDRLEPGARQTLLRAAVIGRRFSPSLLEDIVDDRTNLKVHLNDLERNDLVFPSNGAMNYIFRHDLIRETAYYLILKRQRQLLHRSIGEAIERRYSDQLLDRSPILAGHFKEAEDDIRGRKYALMAGDEAARVYATTEAIIFYRQALAHSRNLDLPLNEQALIYEKLGRSLELASRFEDAFHLYDELEQLALKNNDKKILLSALLAKATLRVIANTFYDPIEGQRLLEEASALADKLGDRSSRAKILWQLMLLDLSTDMDVAARQRYGEEALALAREQEMEEMTAFILHDLWYAYAGSGQWETAIRALEEACRLWRATGNDPLLSESLLRLSLCFQSLGHFDKAIELAEEAFQTALSSDNADQKAISRSLIGEVYFERGEFGKAIKIMRETIDYGIPITNVTACIGTRSDLALVYLELGASDEALALLESAAEVAEDFFFLRPWVQSAQIEYWLETGNMQSAVRAAEQLISSTEQKKWLGSMTPLWIRPGLAHTKVALANKDPDQAIEVVDKLIADLQGEDLHLFLAEALYLKGLALLQAPATAPNQARIVLLSALEEAEQYQLNRILWRILVALAEIEERSGKPVEAQSYRSEASNILKLVVAHIDQPDMRDSFIDREEVRSLIEEKE